MSRYQFAVEVAFYMVTGFSLVCVAYLAGRRDERAAMKSDRTAAKKGRKP